MPASGDDEGGSSRRCHGGATKPLMPRPAAKVAEQARILWVGGGSLRVGGELAGAGDRGGRRWGIEERLGGGQPAVGEFAKAAADDRVGVWRRKTESRLGVRCFLRSTQGGV
jgi:hypothetical protein